jgi:hypothetical protein
MDEEDQQLLAENTSRFTSDLELQEVLPILTDAGLWKDVNQVVLNVCVL